jgi:hypothetical protein
MVSIIFPLYLQTQLWYCTHHGTNDILSLPLSLFQSCGQIDALGSVKCLHTFLWGSDPVVKRGFLGKFSYLSLASNIIKISTLIVVVSGLSMFHHPPPQLSHLKIHFVSLSRWSSLFSLLSLLLHLLLF